MRSGPRIAARALKVLFKRTGGIGPRRLNYIAGAAVAAPMDDKILTRHPQGKKGVNISRAKYETMKKTILEVLRNGGLTHHELIHAVERKLKGKFEGSIPWYMESTKLDLEAGSVIERVAGEKHPFYRVKK